MPRATDPEDDSEVGPALAASALERSLKTFRDVMKRLMSAADSAEGAALAAASRATVAWSSLASSSSRATFMFVV